MDDLFLTELEVLLQRSNSLIKKGNDYPVFLAAQVSQYRPVLEKEISSFMLATYGTAAVSFQLLEDSAETSDSETPLSQLISVAVEEAARKYEAYWTDSSEGKKDTVDVVERYERCNGVREALDRSFRGVKRVTLQAASPLLFTLGKLEQLVAAMNPGQREVLETKYSNPLAFVLRKELILEEKLLVGNVLPEERKLILAKALNHAQSLENVARTNADYLCLARFYFHRAKKEKKRKREYLEKAATLGRKAEQAAGHDEGRLKNTWDFLGRTFFALGQVENPEEKGEAFAAASGYFSKLLEGETLQTRNMGFYAYLAKSLVRAGWQVENPSMIFNAIEVFHKIEEFKDEVSDLKQEEEWEDLDDGDRFIKPETLYSELGEAFLHLGRLLPEQRISHMLQSIEYYTRATDFGKEAVQGYQAYAWLKLGEALLRERENSSMVNFVRTHLQGEDIPPRCNDLAAVCFERSFWDCQEAIEQGDVSPEIRYKAGTAALEIAKLKVERADFNSAADFLRWGKEHLDTAAKDKNTIYPYALLAEMADFAEKEKVDGGLLSKKEYREAALRRFEEGPLWDKIRIASSGSIVAEPTIDHGLLRKECLVKIGDKSLLEEELERIGQARKLFSTASFEIVEPWGMVRHGAQYGLFLQRAPGKTLYAILQTEDEIYSKDSLAAAASALAIIHRDASEMSTISSDYQRKLEERLTTFCQVEGISSSIQGELLQGIPSLAFCLGRSPYLVFNKDAIPENWLINEEGMVVALDWEDKGKVAPEYDLANLLEYNSGISDEVKQEIFAVYAGQSGHPVDQLRYYHAAIHRSLTWLCTWTKDQRHLSQRKPTLQKALGYLHIIQGGCSTENTASANQYSSLEKGIQQLIAWCPS